MTPPRLCREHCEHDCASAEAVVAAAKAEVRARGYRSSDMARALNAHSGNGWFYVEELPVKALCESTVTSEMDDGPLTQRCAKISGHVGDHRYGR